MVVEWLAAKGRAAPRRGRVRAGSKDPDRLADWCFVKVGVYLPYATKPLKNVGSEDKPRVLKVSDQKPRVLEQNLGFSGEIPTSRFFSVPSASATPQVTKCWTN